MIVHCHSVDWNLKNLSRTESPCSKTVQFLRRITVAFLKKKYNISFSMIRKTKRFFFFIFHLLRSQQVTAASISWAVYSSVDVLCPIRRAKELSNWHIPVLDRVIYHVFYKYQTVAWAKYLAVTMKLAAYVHVRSAARSHEWLPPKLSTKSHSTNGNVRAYSHGRFVIDCSRMASVPTIIYPV